MDNALTCLLLLCIVVASCKIYTPAASHSNRSPHDTIDSLIVSLTCRNLSENVTGDDEILFFIYDHNDSATLSAPLFYQRIKMDNVNNKKQYSLKVNTLIEAKNLILFLLEQDTDRPILKIDSIPRTNYNALFQAHHGRNYSVIEKYLGDEDILGIKVLTSVKYTTPIAFTFQGIQKLDRYEYLISIDPVIR
jgi:hypothetical protein